MASSALTLSSSAHREDANRNSSSSSSSSHHHHNMAEMQAVHALLGVSPSFSERELATTSTRRKEIHNNTRPDSYAGLESLVSAASSSSPPKHGFCLDDHNSSTHHTSASVSESPLPLPRNGAEVSTTTGVSLGGLDALATLAFEARSSDGSHHRVHTSLLKGTGLLTTLSNGSSSSSGSNSETEEDMPPPAPRRQRPRSLSNPEGFEKWDTLHRNGNSSSRQHLFLPASILEEELAEASAAIEQRNQQLQQECIPEEEEYHQEEEEGEYEEEDYGPEQEEEEHMDNHLGASPDTVTETHLMDLRDSVTKQRDEVDERHMTPEELLKRARSRLLEDLSESSLNGEKGGIALPHALSKYKEEYNKNGRIGIYTPAERAAIIARFHRKRQRRVWKKKIRYNCRKSLADRRLRVKGRFVKRSEQEQLAKDIHPSQAEDPVDNQSGDQDMPDVNDPEAGFVPTEDQPFRRLRRHTIT